MWWRVLGVLGVVAALAIAAILIGASRWQGETRALVSRMESARLPLSPSRYDPEELEGLPEPVRRYFRAVLTEGQPLVAGVRVEHTGTFNMSETGEQWRPFTSTQHVITRRPGFVWDARIRMAPGMKVHVHDAYVAGEGVLRAKLLGLVTVMSQPATPELSQGELMRFFAESAWYPTALLPSQGVVWEPIDHDRASATLSDGGTTITLVFLFDEEGLIRAVRSEGRFRTVGAEQVLTPWEGRYWNYQERDGMRIPLEGEVAWLLEDGPRPYWRGRIEAIQYLYQ